MMKIISTYKTLDIVVVPFPFTDAIETKKRPAIVLSSSNTFNTEAGHSVLAMITSAQHNSWPRDTFISNLSSCGLQKPSIIRLKLFTIDHRLIIEKIGSLSTKDQKALRKNFTLTFSQLID